MGRQLKYRFIIELLEEDVLYTSGSISRIALERGLVPDEDLIRGKRRIRVAMANYVKAHEFPRDGDGIVFLKGQSPTPGWFGWRWKAAIPK